MKKIILKAEKREKKKQRIRNRRPSLAAQKKQLEQVGYYVKNKKIIK